MTIETYDPIKIVVKIDPLPTKETQHTVVKGRAWSYTPKEKATYMKSCLPFLYQYAGWATKGDIIKAEFIFYKRPEHKTDHGRLWLHKAPDTDNLVKPIKDCLGTRAILREGGDKTFGAKVIWDDSQIVHEISWKFWDETRPRIVIKLCKIKDKYHREENLFSFK
jgi:Holliday junction resolvase RusA-like endonuclease